MPEGIINFKLFVCSPYIHKYNKLILYTSITTMVLKVFRKTLMLNYNNQFIDEVIIDIG